MGSDGVGLWSLGGAPGWAEDKRKHHGHDPEKKLQTLTEKLELTEGQQAKIKPDA
ncbi:MAG: hypothetical protein NPIRA04_18640 [Nitrospirales bacterium]|nr:MAG: hypothetical protein NPIRA04_18640 [Nitrospirales bacterium]